MEFYEGSFMAVEKIKPSLGSVWVMQNVEEIRVIIAPKRRLLLDSIKTQKLDASSKSGENIIPKNELSNTLY